MAVTRHWCSGNVLSMWLNMIIIDYILCINIYIYIYVHTDGDWWWMLRQSCVARATCRQESRGQGKTALVTGITGMLGSHVAEALLERGYEVHGVVRPRSNVRNVAAFQSKVKMITGELTDPWRVLRLVQKLKPDFIFHFAAQAFNSLSFEQPAETLHTNLMSVFDCYGYDVNMPCLTILCTASRFWELKIITTNII